MSAPFLDQTKGCEHVCTRRNWILMIYMQCLYPEPCRLFLFAHYMTQILYIGSLLYLKIIQSTHKCLIKLHYCDSNKCISKWSEKIFKGEYSLNIISTSIKDTFTFCKPFHM